MHPSAPAQIHVPQLAPPLPFRIRASLIVARRRFGVTLLAAGPLLTVVTLAFHPPSSLAPLFMVGTWLAALVIGALTAARAGSWRSFEEPSARVSWALLFAGLALALPLTLHGLVQPWEWAPRVYDQIGDRSYGGWLVASMLLTGPSHVVFAVLCAIRGYRGDGAPHLAVIGIVTTGVTAAIDGLLWGSFGLLPALYVGVTTVPVLYILRRIERAGV